MKTTFQGFLTSLLLLIRF